MPDFKQEPIAPIQFANPVEQYQNILKTQYLASEIAKAQREEDDSTAQNNAGKIPGAFNPDGTPNIGIMTNHLAGVGQAKSIPGLQQKYAMVNQTNAKAKLDASQAGKADIEAQMKTLEYFRDRWKSVDPTSPDAQTHAYQIIKEEAANPLLAKLAADNGVKPQQHIEQRVAELQSNIKDPQTLAAWVTNQSMSAKDAAAALEQKVMNIDGGDHNSQYRVDKQGNMVLVGTTPKKMADHSVRVTVDTGAGNSYAKKMGEGHAERDLNMEAMATSAPQVMSHLGRMIALLKSGKVLTGAGADAQLEAYRGMSALGQHGFDDVINATQEYDKLTSGNVLDQTMERNKAGLGSRTTVTELNMVKDASARKHLGMQAQLNILQSAYDDIQETIPKFNTRLDEVKSSPTIGGVPKTLSIQPVPHPPAPPKKQETAEELLNRHGHIKGGN